MKKLLLAFSVAALSSIAAFGQTISSNDYKKGEFYVGYSNGQVDTGLDTGNSVSSFFRDRANFNGVNVSGVYNVTRFVGIKGDVSATFNSTRFGDSFVDPTTGTTFNTSFKTSNSLTNVVGGIQVKDNSNEGRFKPFAHAMAGIGHGRTKVSDVQCTPSIGCPVLNETFSDTGFAGVFGGGLDIRLGNHFQIRAIQVDYNPVRASGTTSNNLRLGAGIVF